MVSKVAERACSSKFNALLKIRIWHLNMGNLLRQHQLFQGLMETQQSNGDQVTNTGRIVEPVYLTSSFSSTY